MKIIVTGGAGFIGSHLCRRLVENGDEVLCVDSLLTGHEANIRELLGCGRFSFLSHDITQPLQGEAEQIYNLACPASPAHYQRNLVHTAKTSFLGALHMLELARNCHARILQASTSEVYGDPAVHPQTESYWGNVNPIGVRACYDEGKRVAETLFMDYHRQYGVETKIVRIFNTYGPYMSADDGRVVTNFVTQALRGEPLTVFGDGTQTRSFCYVDDLVEGIIRMMNSRKDFTGPVNLGNPQEFTVLELANLTRELTGSKSEIVFLPLPEDDPCRRKPMIDLAEAELGWMPKTPLREGLKKTIDFFKTSSEDARLNLN